MSVSRRPRMIGVCVAVLLLLAGTGWGIWRASDAYHVGRLCKEMTRGDSDHRTRILWELGSVGGARAAEIAVAVLRDDEQAALHEPAAYALQKMRATEHYELVRQVAVNSPPNWAQGKMAMYAGRLGGERAGPWLREVSEGPPSWVGVGAALARVEAGDLQADEIVFAYLRDRRKAWGGLAARTLVDWIVRMSEAIGRPIDLPARPERGLFPKQADRVIDWWRRYATPKLIRDNVAWQRRRNPKWRRMARLMHVRGQAMDYLEID